MESNKSRLIVTLLAFFLGVFGVHRFYVGKIGTGIIWLLTFGCLGFGATIDLVFCVCGKFKDKNGNIISKWNV